MEIGNIKLAKPLILVETDKLVDRGTYSAKVVKTAIDSEYKAGNTIYTDSNFFIPFSIDGRTFENIYQVNETTIKGEII